MRLRPFGACAEDLDVEFGRPRPEVVTAVLRRCLERDAGGAPAEDAVWDLSVGARIEALLHLAALAGPAALPVALRCGGCRERIEIELTAEEVRHIAEGAAGEPQTVRLAGHTLPLRRPTGRDQLAWAGRAFANPREARTAVARRLCPGLPEAPAEQDLAALEAALQRLDPLVGLRVEVTCPACDRTLPQPVDLEAAALARLAAVQAGLLERVAALALRFHWREADVLALPAWRQERYLAIAERRA